MFSLSEKQHLAAEIEKLLLALKHPEMPNERPRFSLHVDGMSPISWADISPNWTFEQKPPTVNPFNEIARQVLNDNEMAKINDLTRKS